MHDIGNAINRVDHAHSGAIMAYNILKDMEMDVADRTEIMMAIGNHDEATGTAVRDFTEQEKAFMDANAYNYRKRCIKDRNLTSDRVKALMDEYYSYPYARNKGKLRYKYFWYRVIAPLFH